MLCDCRSFSMYKWLRCVACVCVVVTGHGVGAALNVHEGPQSISMRFHNLTPLQPNMVGVLQCVHRARKRVTNLLETW